MKWQELTDSSARTEVRDAILTHQELLRTHLAESATLARNFLLVVNAGAAVALMAFMGNSPKIRASAISWICLGCFLSGVVFVGILSALDYQVKVAQFRTWLKNANAFFRNTVDLDVVYSCLEPVEKRFGFAPAIAGYLAFLCFIVGGAVAVEKFLNSNLHPHEGPYAVTGTGPICAIDDKANTMLCGYYSQEQCQVDPLNRPPTGFCVVNPALNAPSEP